MTAHPTMSRPSDGSTTSVNVREPLNAVCYASMWLQGEGCLVVHWFQAC